ncbi:MULTISPECIES: cytochrome c biogenesis protein ResB [unclassified Marinitoga]|uniref:cytochrome c biogenesis protein ResB n=1 Tax=unclassified Marinitoga TaxID=2640159 RepID=UPI0006416531|nr:MULTISPECIES: cytochrome c biogenesis protein ResB [unclassified Marinitoga]KLO23980.1 hypothetical protein X274_05565 [Marinitoga sp. 1155]NUU99172.1 hypothetical protein [Marinitoga sp. 1154]
MIFKWLKSIKLAVILMIIISIFSALGTFVPQHQIPEYYYSKYGALFGKLIVLLQLDHYSNSILFGFLLSLFFINTLFCTLFRILKIYPVIFSNNVNTNNIVYFEGNMDELIKKLKKSKYKVKIKEGEIFAVRSLIGKIGPDFIHIGILIAIISGLIIGLTTQTETFYLSPGDEFQIEDEKLMLMDFIVENYDNGMVKDWISKVKYKNNIANIEVNKPLNLEHGRLYQWSYKIGWNVKLYFDGLNYTYEGPELKDFDVENYHIKISRFIPHLKVKNGKIFNMSNDPVNPAILVEYYDYLGIKLARQWVFEKIDYPSDPPGFNIKAKIIGYEKIEKTGLLYSTSKGDTGMFIALLIISLGVIFSIKRDYNKIIAYKEKDKIKVIIYEKKYLSEF